MEFVGIDFIKVLAPTALAFFIGIAITPALTDFLYSHKMWKKKSGKGSGVGGGATPIFDKLHKEKEVGTPKMGGVIVWGSAALTILLVWLLSQIAPSETTQKLDFLSRSQTWLPLFTLVAGSLIGLMDDYFEIAGNGDYLPGGLSLKKRLAVVLAIGAVGAWWFFVKLGISTMNVPFGGTLELGLMFIPVFILVMMAVYSGGVIDGIDGLSGGVFGAIFSAYAIIAFFQHQLDLAAFCAVIVGALLAFLWFNIPPARFYLSETGSMGLTITLAVVAFLTDSVLVLPILAFPLFITTLSDIIQVISKKTRNGKKVFLVAPIHHHFEAIGWPPYKVTMRFWVISIISAVLGVVIVLAG